MEKNATENAECDKGKGLVDGDVAGQQWAWGLPRFLVKTYLMVDDQKTNSIISWNSSGTALVVWDHHKFSSEILPTYFKTTQFSSFVYQLNNYGFSKIRWGQSEYANKWFHAGKKEWLKNIKRRNQQQQSQVSKISSSSSCDHVSTNDVMKRKVDTMMSEQNEMKLKIEELRQSLDNLGSQISSLKQVIMQLLRNSNDEVSGHNSKRPRLDEKKATEKNVENFQFWTKMLEDDANGEHGDLAACHSKAIMELDEMMASRIEIQKEIMISKQSDTEGEDDGNLELWT